MGSRGPCATGWKTLLLLLAVASGLAVWAAQPFVGGWNDGSRLATVECLVDHRTFAIEQSVFTRPALREGTGSGTQDKLFIRGHYYSDKSPSPALLLALGYQCWRWADGPTAAQRPDTFCYAANLASAGFAYVISIVCLFILGRRVGLSPGICWLLVGSLGLGTVALPYAAHVNNHTCLLSVVFLIVLQLQRLVQHRESGSTPGLWSWLGLGLLTGLGYTIDLGIGPVLFVTTAIWVTYNGRGQALVPFVLGALPCLALHHGLNFAVGGTFYLLCC